MGDNSELLVQGIVFILYDKLNSIVSKTAKLSSMDFSTIAQPQGTYYFSEQRDIDRAQSISDVDRQFYTKYGLDEKEIAFIEEKVRAME